MVLVLTVTEGDRLHSARRLNYRQRMPKGFQSPSVAEIAQGSTRAGAQGRSPRTVLAALLSAIPGADAFNMRNSLPPTLLQAPRQGLRPAVSKMNLMSEEGPKALSALGCCHVPPRHTCDQQMQCGSREQLLSSLASIVMSLSILTTADLALPAPAHGVNVREGVGESVAAGEILLKEEKAVTSLDEKPDAEEIKEEVTDAAVDSAVFTGVEAAVVLDPSAGLLAAVSGAVEGALEALGVLAVKEVVPDARSPEGSLAVESAVALTTVSVTAKQKVAAATAVAAALGISLEKVRREREDDERR